MHPPKSKTELLDLLVNITNSHYKQLLGVIDLYTVIH